MEKKEIKEILNQKYDRENWKFLAKNIFNNVEYFKTPISIKTDNEKILDFVQIGNLKLIDQKKVALFELKLIKNLNIYKNKVELRNIVTKFIDQYSNHGVLVVFDNQGSDYRLTFSSKYSEFDENGNIIEVETSSKRYTYLLGENESCATAAERLYLLHHLQDNLKIGDILNAFNVDKITDDFFNTYKKLYLRLYDEIDRLKKEDKNIKRTFEKNTISNEEFSKKLLGQLVFIYFLQKKGWLGLKKDKNNIYEKWGTGDKNFIRNLFNGKYCKYKNFFNDVLEPLFVAFSTDLPENYYSQLDTKIPFLNGGLFDPIKNYDWVDTKITISDKLIEEILDNFEMYNFTIQEEDPEEKEVAIDPEMLGKVFENLLEIKDKKSKGTFYTPRKIAKYICEETLINYFINIFGENSKINFKNMIKNIEDKNLCSFFKKNYEKIDEKIKNIKICDPAIGSGEFPVELMNLCVSLRLKLNNYFTDRKRTSYLMKIHFIKNSIYGVDIEDSAVETAKLRLWLSLIIDEDDYNKILPLPNLEYKIFKGDSLLSFEKNLETLILVKEITKLKDEYFSEVNIKKKIELKKNIDAKFNSILGSQNSFDYHIFFEEVFREKNGFDLVIGNPPYVQIQKINDENYKKKLKETFEVFSGNSDLYCLFLERGYKLLNDKGCLGFITSNKWLKTTYGDLLRKFFLNKSRIIQLIDFKSLQIFKRASVDTSILVIKKGEFIPFKACQIKSIIDYRNFESAVNNSDILLDKDNLQGPWTITEKDKIILLSKIKKFYNRISLGRKSFRRGVTTGLNKVFILDEKIYNKHFIKNNKSNEIIHRILQGKHLNKFGFINSEKNWILFTKQGINIKNYKLINNYLKKYYDDLQPRKNKKDKRGRKPGNYKWYEIQDNTAYHKLFDLPKVAWMNMNRQWKFTYVPSGYFLEASLNFVANEKYAKFLVGIYSSSLHRWFFKQIGRMFDDGGFMCKIDTISQFPVVEPKNNEKLIIEKYVDKLTKYHNQKDENKLNEIVMDLYGLNKTEKNIIRSSA